MRKRGKRREIKGLDNTKDLERKKEKGKKRREFHRLGIHTSFFIGPYFLEEERKGKGGKKESAFIPALLSLYTKGREKKSGYLLRGSYSFYSRITGGEGGGEKEEDKEG